MAGAGQTALLKWLLPRLLRTVDSAPLWRIIFNLSARMKHRFLLVFWPTVSLSWSCEERRLKQGLTTGSSSPALTGKSSPRSHFPGQSPMGILKEGSWGAVGHAHIFQNLPERDCYPTQPGNGGFSWWQAALGSLLNWVTGGGPFTWHITASQRELTWNLLNLLYTDFIKHASAGAEFYSLSLKCLMAFMIIKIICLQYY